MLPYLSPCGSKQDAYIDLQFAFQILQQFAGTDYIYH